MKEPAVSDADDCSRCHRISNDNAHPLLLVQVLGGRYLCGQCWRKAGQPSAVAPRLSDSALYLQEQETRRNMVKHGGTAKHLVAKGIS